GPRFAEPSSFSELIRTTGVPKYRMGGSPSRCSWPSVITSSRLVSSTNLAASRRGNDPIPGCRRCIEKSISLRSTHPTKQPAALQCKLKKHRRALAEIALFRRGREPAHRVAREPGGDGEVLPAVDRICHRRRVDAGADVEAPQFFKGLVVERHDRAFDQR